MDLTSDLPYWTVRNGIVRAYPPLEGDIRCDALIVGGGISGALLAHRLSSSGVDCVVIDRRDIGFGSTSASTALLQYEIDTPLRLLSKKVAPDSAERAYRAGIESIHRLKRLAGGTCGFAMRPSLQIATRVAHVRGLELEYALRRKLKFPVRFLSQSDLKARGIVAQAALRSSVAAEVDPFRLTHRLFRVACAKGTRVFDRTTALSYRHSRGGVTVKTDRGHRIRCGKIFFSTGYEAQDILPRGIVTFKSTYAMVSEPLPDLNWWRDRSLIWGTGNPYLYFRTTPDNRILAGGEDDGVLNPERRDRQIAHKTSVLVQRFGRLFPKRRIEPAFGWAGLFGSTKDGLAYIGAHPSFPRAYFALGYGGNGITFGEIAACILTDLFLDRANPDAHLFRFDR